MDLDQVGGSDFGPVFKVVNIVVSAVSNSRSQPDCTILRRFISPSWEGEYVSIHLEANGLCGLNTNTFYLVYLFLGTVLVNGNIFGIIGGVIVLLVGAVYVALEFIPSIEPPANMQNGGSMISDDVEDII
ncbi:unnamed protein product [Kuraishia capsulata CBS 1993]|uniref:Uncharacterized protein n=1 Tax=Kuraishia capsulata CBS 1993 TaxID=1382522 RepID=W6MV04_9ASCO|nr:uncharacterized protein KUCA_T00005690001 [Kuraishia capsulata CBS 1993]CDK29697.1 unnamed protein product [Kuraishia capsulata CBS 1993]